MNARRLVIVEPDHHGHRMNYVRILVEYCRKRSIVPALASADRTFQSDEYRSRPVLRSAEGINLGKWPAHEYPAWFRRTVSALIRSEPGAEIMVLEGDKRMLDLLRTWGRARHRPSLTVLVMRVPRLPTTPREALLFITKTVLGLAIRLRGGRVVGLSPARPVASRYRFRGWPAAPDPVDFIGPSTRVADAHDKGRLALGIFGHVTARKNVPAVLQSLTNNPARHDLEVVIRGRIDPDLLPDVEAAASSARGRGLRVVLEDVLLSDDELQEGVASVDAVIAAYSSTGPSGIVALSVSVGTVLLTVGNRELAEATSSMGGSVVDLRGGLPDLGTAGWIEDVRASVATPRVLANGDEFARTLVDGD